MCPNRERGRNRNTEKAPAQSQRQGNKYPCGDGRGITDTFTEQKAPHFRGGLAKNLGLYLSNND